MSYLADSEVEPHVNDHKHKEQVERTNNKQRLLQQKNLVEGVVELLKEQDYDT